MFLRTRVRLCDMDRGRTLQQTLKGKIKWDYQVELRISVRFESGICEHFEPAPCERTKSSGCSLITRGQSKRSGAFALK